MAQSLFDAIVDNNTYLTVHPLLEAQPIHDGQNTHQQQQRAPPQATDDVDVFQCGKCKLQFTSLPHFMQHKQTCVVRASNHQHVVQQPQQQMPQQHVQHNVYQQQQQSGISPNTTLNQLSTNIVLPDDMMTLTLDTSSTGTLHVQGAAVQNNPFLSSAIQIGNTNQNHTQAQTNTQSVSLLNATYDGNTVAISSLPTTMSGQFQIQPVAMVQSQQHQNTGQATVSNQQNSGNGVITVLMEENDQNLLHIPANTHATTVNQSQVIHIQQPEPVLRQITDVTLQEEPAVKTKKKTKKTILKQPLNCQWCKKTFTKTFDLQQHIRAHTGEKPFQCVVCGRAFSQKSNVKKHMETHKVWPLSSKTNPTLPEQPAPQLVVVQERDVRKVRKPYTSAGEAENIDNSNKDDHSYQSSQGNLNTERTVSDDDIASIKWHFLVDSAYVCPYCPSGQTRFDNFYKLRSHLVEHKTEQVYKCILRTCDKTFVELDDFLEHTRDHEARSELTYRCHVCNKQFETLDELGGHQYVHSTKDSSGLTEMAKRKRSDWRWRCLECGRTYTSPEALEQHMATTNHDFPCPHCDKTLSSNKLLRRHLQTHVNETFTCDICHKSLKSEYYMKMHKLIHTGELPFSCEVCGKRFNRKDKVNRHMLTHDPVKKFVCPFKTLTGCDRSFNRSDKLKEHLKKHSGKDTMKKSVVTTINTSTVNQSASNGLIMVQPTLSIDTSTIDISQYRCKHCHCSGFESVQLHKTHEMLCEKIPKMKCLKCWSTFATSEEYDTHNCATTVPIENVYVSHTSTQKTNSKRPTSKKKRKARIELSPPPVRRRVRSARTRRGVSPPPAPVVVIGDSAAPDVELVGETIHGGDPDKQTSQDPDGGIRSID